GGPRPSRRDEAGKRAGLDEGRPEELLKRPQRGIKVVAEGRLADVAEEEELADAHAGRLSARADTRLLGITFTKLKCTTEPPSEWGVLAYNRGPYGQSTVPNRPRLLSVRSLCSGFRFGLVLAALSRERPAEIG